MNLSYLNKNISKCTIYIKQIDLRVVYKKILQSKDILIPKITKI